MKSFFASSLTLALLAALGLSAENAAAGTTAPAPSFNPSGTVTYPGDSQTANSFGTGTGNIAGTALPTGSNGVTGAKYVGTANFTEAAAGRGGTSGSLMEFNISGSGSGILNTGDSSIPLIYSFTLGTTATGNSMASITGWTLNLSVTTSSGTATQTVTNTTGGAGTFSGVTSVAATGASSGAALSGYAASLVVNYTLTGAGTGATMAVTVPTNSIDFNGAVPEPGTWTTLALGAAVAGLGWRRARSRREAV